MFQWNKSNYWSHRIEFALNIGPSSRELFHTKVVWKVSISFRIVVHKSIANWNSLWPVGSGGMHATERVRYIRFGLEGVRIQSISRLGFINFSIDRQLIILNVFITEKLICIYKKYIKLNWFPCSTPLYLTSGGLKPEVCDGLKMEVNYHQSLVHLVMV